jgi:LPXTG-site transpeptidase (sortase) family protein
LKGHIKELLIIVFAIFFAVVLCFLNRIRPKEVISQVPPVPKKQVTAEVSPGPPVHLIIPVINVDANIQPLGVDANGEMEMVENTIDVGWFEPGSKPGEKGSAVMAGHLDGRNSETGVFSNLDKLKPGDKLYVEDNKGLLRAFVVRESRVYDPGYAEEVFSSNDKAHLNLITCDGSWDGSKKSYTKRLVVFTDLIR